MKLRRHWPILLPLAFAGSVFHAWISAGLILGDDQFRFSGSVIGSDFPWRSAWDGSVLFGSATADASPSYPLWSVAGALTRAGVDFSMVERLLWLWPLLACLVIAPYAFAYRLTRNPWAASIAAAVFAVNTWTVGLVQRGHIPSLVAYALMPFALLAWQSLIAKRTPWIALLFAAVVTLQVMYDLRYAYITAIACLISAAISFGLARSRRQLSSPARSAKTVLWVSLALLAFNSYWLVPQLLAPARLPAGYDTLPFYLSASSSESLWHALALFFPFYRYVQGTDPFGQTPVEWAFFALPLLVAVSIIAARRRPWALALGACAFLGVVVVSGPDSPFGALNEFAFLHLPGMKLFRDCSKFTALVALSYSILLALGFGRAHAIVRMRTRGGSGWIAAGSACVVIVAYAGLMRDAYDPARHSNFAATTLSPSDIAMQAYLDRQPGFFRSVLYPTWRPMLVGTETHPVVSADTLLDSALQDGGLGDLFPPSATLVERLDSPLIPALLAEARVRYVIVDEDPNGELYKQFAYDVQYAESVEFFRTRPWLKEATAIGRYVVFEVVPPMASRAFFAPAPIAVAGTPQSLVALVGTPEWRAPPAVEIAGQSTGRRSDGWTFTTDPALDADGIAASFDAGRTENVRAYAGAQASSIVAHELRSRMIAASELIPTVLPAEAPLPSDPVTVEIADPRVMSAPYADPAPGVRWFGVTGSAADIALVNWSGVDQSGEIQIARAFSPDGQEREIRATLGTKTQQFSLAPEILRFARASSIDMRGVILVPGLNVLHLSISSPPERASRPRYSVIFADDLRVATQPIAGPAIAIARFTLRATPEGIQVSVRGDGRSSRAVFAIYRGLAIPLSHQPTLTLTYAPPANPARLALYLDLRRRRDGGRILFVHALPSGSTLDQLDIARSVQAALDAEPRATIRGIGPEASEFELKAVSLAISTSPAARADFHAIVSTAAIADGTSVAAARVGARYVDLRQSKIGRRLHAVATARQILVSAGAPGDLRDFEIVIPITDDEKSSESMFWLRHEGGVVPNIDLTFTKHGAVSLDVPAAARPSATDPDAPLPSGWQQTVTHVAGGTAGLWQRFDIDLDDVRAYRLPDHGAGYALSAMRIDNIVSQPGQRATLSNVVLLATKSNSAGAAPISQRFVVNRLQVPMRDVHADAQTGRIIGASEPFAIGGSVDISVDPTLPLRFTSLYIARAHAPAAAPGAVTGFAELSPAEYEGRVSGRGGVLVWPSGYAPGWHAYFIKTPGVLPSGFTTLDALRLAAYAVPGGRHVAVNGIFNGWHLDAGDGLLVLLYEPDAASQFGALLWVVLSLAVVAAASMSTRGRP